MDEGGSEESSSLAEFYFGILNQFPDESQGPRYGQGWLPQRRDFVRRFFSNEPELKRGFQNWIAALRRTSHSDSR
jgi:hypothetical protein